MQIYGRILPEIREKTWLRNARCDTVCSKWIGHWTLFLWAGAEYFQMCVIIAFCWEGLRGSLKWLYGKRCLCGYWVIKGCTVRIYKKTSMLVCGTSWDPLHTVMVVLSVWVRHPPLATIPWMKLRQSDPPFQSCPWRQCEIRWCPKPFFLSDHSPGHMISKGSA